MTTSLTFTPREPRTDGQLELEARTRRYIDQLMRDALDPDDVLSTVAFKEIAYLMEITPDGYSPHFPPARPGGRNA